MSPNSNKPNTYMATLLPGLESITQDELRVKVRDAHRLESTRGKVFFSSQQSITDLFQLKTVDNLYQVLGWFELGPHKVHLQDLERLMSQMDLSSAWEHKREPRFLVNASRSGKHTYSRFELADAASRGIQKQAPTAQIETPGNHEIEFRLDLTGSQGVFSLRLTPPTFRFRGERHFAKAALRPTVAHALIWQSQPSPQDQFMDPFCGSGTLITERANYPAQQLFGGDISASAIATTRQNMTGIRHLHLQEWDATNLPLDPSSINKVVTNLPFGKQILPSHPIKQLYFRFISELRRVLSDDGHALLLTDQVELLQKATERQNISMNALCQLKLKGLHPTLFHLIKH